MSILSNDVIITRPHLPNGVLMLYSSKNVFTFEEVGELTQFLVNLCGEI